MVKPEKRNLAQDPPLTADYEARRDELTDRIAAIVLADGLESLTLRVLAEKLATSGRMLLYYFKTRDDLVVATLRRISARLNSVLAQRPRQTGLTPGAFLAGALATSSDPAIGPFVRVWTEVIARAARGEQPFQQVVSDIVISWLDWIESQLIETADPADRTRATAILSIVEGSLLLEAARPGSTTTARAYLVQVLNIDADATGRL
jgi:AcrR family transcriptional regulator